jgi:hypothetical protein
MSHQVTVLIMSVWLVSATGCRSIHSPASTPEIINGSESAIPSVVAVMRTDSSGYCTGAMIGSTLAVTARHCVAENSPGCGVTILGRAPATCFVDQAWVPDNTSAANAIHDVAILVFRTDDVVNQPGWPLGRQLRYGLLSEPLDLLGAQVQIVGYGRTDWQGHVSDQAHISGGQGVGIGGASASIFPQHQCSNRVSAVDAEDGTGAYGLIHFAAEDRTHGACMPSFGDSGGPLLRWDSATNKHVIVGLASTVYYPATGKQDAAYVVLIRDVIVALVEQAVDWSIRDACERAKASGASSEVQAEICGAQ